MKRACLKIYVNDMGFRGLERVKRVYHTTVIASDRYNQFVVNSTFHCLFKILSCITYKLGI